MSEVAKSSINKQKPNQKINPLIKIKKLLSNKSKYLVSAGIIVAACAIAGFNIYAKNNEDSENSFDDSSILLSLITSEDDILETVTSNFEHKNGKEKERFSLISIASATSNAPASLTASMLNSSQTTNSEQSLALVGENTLLKNSPTDTEISNKPRTEIAKYTVKEGDTVSSIAKKFGIDAATILTESKKYADDIIKPGEELTILPVSGTTERVDEGETLEGIARKHEANVKKIMAFNKLLNPSDVEVGQILIIPDGNREVKMRPRPEVQPSRRTQLAYNSYRSPRSYSSTPTVQPGPRVGNKFPWGYCTWYAAQRRGDVTWRGSAGQWLNNAQAQGKATGRIPAKGAIIVTSESWWGHVGVVESVQGDKVTISEMNYNGYGVVSKRTISNSSGVIKGYIY
jgi:surface antigen/transposase-like protein